MDAETSAKLLEIITAECERLTRIAGDILLANTLDSGRLQLDEDRVELGPLARNVVDEMRTCFVERDDIEIDLIGSDGTAPVLADENRLRQVLTSLLQPRPEIHRPPLPVWRR